MNLVSFKFLAVLLISGSMVTCGAQEEELSTDPPIVNIREREKAILDEILGPARYDRRIRSSAVNGTDGPTVVDVNLMFRSFPTISDSKMEYSTVMTFREEWMDDRLVYDDFNGKIKYLTLTDSKKVWMPDLFFSNEREGHIHSLIIPNIYIRIFPDGRVLYSIRISLTLSCPMNLKMYPLDQQTCSLAMASYGYTTEDVVFRWKDTEPVQVATDLRLPRFHLEKLQTGSCNSVTNTGEYSCLKVDLLFRRDFSYYLVQIYFPCAMLIIVSWFSFWLDPQAAPARVSLGITTLLTMATQTSSINNTLPPVSYTKAIDVWTGACMTFVFCALLEYALVNKLSRSDKHRDNRQKQKREAAMNKYRSDPQQSLDVQSQQKDDCTVLDLSRLTRRRAECLSADSLETDPPCCPTAERGCCSWIAKFPSRSKRIDIISRVLFPLMFALFNLIYWSVYLSS